MTLMNKSSDPPRDWLLKAAEIEDSCRSVSVGGLAADSGMTATADGEPELGTYAPPRPRRVLHSDVVEFSLSPLDSLSALSRGWNGYDAEPPSDGAIGAATGTNGRPAPPT